MSSLLDKTKEVTKTLVPVVVLVLIICFTIVDVGSDVLVRFGWQRPSPNRTYHIPVGY